MMRLVFIQDQVSFKKPVDAIGSQYLQIKLGLITLIARIFLINLINHVTTKKKHKFGHQVVLAPQQWRLTSPLSCAEKPATQSPVGDGVGVDGLSAATEVCCPRNGW